jgi:sulfur carrier protein
MGESICLEVNGERREFVGVATIADLLRSCALEPLRVAVEVNEALVRRGRFVETQLKSGDRVEIVTFVGGG